MNQYSKILIELSMLDKAEDLDQWSHKNQFRRSSKKPYIIHPKRVQLLARDLGYPKKIQIIALLHDVIEDSDDPVVLDRIKYTFGEEVFNALLALTHEKQTSYKDYLLGVATNNPLAFKVKMVDMYDNLTDNPSPKQVMKYRDAIIYLIDNGFENIPSIILNTLKI